jgi:hypothetical protein
VLTTASHWSLSYATRMQSTSHPVSLDGLYFNIILPFTTIKPFITVVIRLLTESQSLSALILFLENIIEILNMKTVFTVSQSKCVTSETKCYRPHSSWFQTITIMSIYVTKHETRLYITVGRNVISVLIAVACTSQKILFYLLRPTCFTSFSDFFQTKYETTNNQPTIKHHRRL